MSEQPNKHSHAEAFANVVVGGVISVALTMILFGVTAHTALGVTVIFAVASYLRSYLIRRAFNAWPTIWNMSHRVPRASTETPATLTFKRSMARLSAGWKSLKTRFASLCWIHWRCL